MRRFDEDSMRSLLEVVVTQKTVAVIALAAVVVVASCSQGDVGPPGPLGPAGPPGAAGQIGGGGANGTNGNDITNSAGAPDGAVADAGSPPPKDGTRLKSRTSTVTTTTTSSDGAETVTSYQQSGWFDTQRNEPCAFTMAADDKTRCLPTSLAVRDNSGGSYFSDAACTQALAFTIKSISALCGSTVIPGPPTPKYILFSKAGSECAGVAIGALGAPVVPGASVYLKSGASCFATPPSSSYDYYAGTAEISPTEFVESSTTIVTSN